MGINDDVCTKQTMENKLSGNLALKSIRCSTILCWHLNLTCDRTFCCFLCCESCKRFESTGNWNGWKVNVENNLTTIGLAPANPNTYCLLLLSKCSALFKRAAMDEVKRHRHYQQDVKTKKTKWFLTISHFMFLASQSDAHWHFHYHFTHFFTKRRKTSCLEIFIWKWKYFLHLIFEGEILSQS